MRRVISGVHRREVTVGRCFVVRVARDRRYAGLVHALFVEVGAVGEGVSGW